MRTATGSFTAISSPATSLLTADGHPKILDFGLAVLLAGGKATGRMTQAGTIVGSLPYMAPEQLFGEADDARTDVYALGAMLFEMVTGQAAVRQGTPRGVDVRDHQQCGAESVRSIRPEPRKRSTAWSPSACTRIRRSVPRRRRMVGAGAAAESARAGQPSRRSPPRAT